MSHLLGCITQEHDLRLVAQAACICVIASFTTLSLVARAQVAKAPASGLWLLGAAVVFGCGVWSLHFVTMLAFLTTVPIAYDISMTIGSVVIAVLGAWLALGSWHLMRSHFLGTMLGGVMLGLAVSGTHYAGVHAMRLAGSLAFSEDGIVASIVISAVFGCLALARARNLSRLTRRLEVSAWLALAVCGLHFTGMAALTILPSSGVQETGGLLGSKALAIAVGTVSLALLVISLAATLMDQHLSERAVMELLRMRLLGSLSQEVMLIHRDGLILEVNSAGVRLFDAPIACVIGRQLLDFVDADSRHVMSRAVQSSDEPAKLQEIQIRNASGQLVPVEFSCSRLEFEGRLATVVVMRDLSDRRRDEARIRHLAHHDALTDLPNRFLLQDRLIRALDRAAREGALVAVLYLDLDRFKPVNDLLGHAAGDCLLRLVARRLQGELRAADTLARVGGDEFVIVASMMSQPQQAADLAARLTISMARPFDLEGRPVEIGVTIGIAVYPCDGGSQETLMHAADTALYRAKEEQRGTFRFFEPSMDEHLQERRQLEQDLRHAVERDELELHYQPLVNCNDGAIDGYEALLRWRHPRRGLIAPMNFIPLAEETGQISAIGEWVIQAACQEASGWSNQCSISVNVSPVQFRCCNLVEIVLSALSQSGLAASRLEIEVTESVLLDQTCGAVGTLAALRREGVRVSLDDFGTGYSSLGYLRSFVFDKIKIDKSFIKGLGQSDEANILVRTIIGLGHNLGLSITAEGVETKQQLEMIQAEGCDQVQGFLLGRPAQMTAVDTGPSRTRSLLRVHQADAAD